MLVAHNLVKYLWQLPQNLLGLLCVWLSKAKLDKDKSIYVAEYFFNSGISLGNYIILQDKLHDDATIAHEKGHQKQSLYLGWLYLIIVGIPSISRNIWDILTHKKWSYEKRIKWYYGGYPEKWADKLGGVIR